MALENKDIRKTIRFTESEYDNLINSSKKFNMKLSEYIRFKLFNNDNVVNINSCGAIQMLIDYKKELALQKVDSKDIYSSHMLTQKINLINEIIAHFDR